MKTIGRRRGWRIAIRSLLLTAAVVVILATAAKYSILPQLARQQIISAIRAQWDGPVKIAEVRFNYLGPIVVTGLTVSDRDNRPWLSMKTATVHLANWPGMHPRVSRVDVQDLAMTCYSRDGRMTVPLRPAPPKSATQPAGAKGQEPSLDLPEVRLEGGRITLVDENGAGGGFSNLAGRLRRQGKRYEIEIESRSAQQKPLSLRGNIDARDGSANLELRLRGLQAAETGMWLSVLDVLVLKDVQGRLDGTVKISGPLAQPGRWQVAGQASLEDFAVSTARGRAIESFRGKLGFDIARDIRVEIKEGEGQSCGGRIAGSASLVYRPQVEGGRLECRGSLQAEGLGVRRLLTEQLGVNFEVPYVTRMYGNIQGAVQVCGVGDTSRPVRTIGRAEFQGINLDTPYGRLVSGLGGIARLVDLPESRLEVSDVRGGCCGGTLACKLDMIFPPRPGGLALGGGVLLLAKVDVRELAQVTINKTDARSGLLTGRLNAEVQPIGGEAAYRTRGAIVVQDGDLGPSEHVKVLYGHLGISPDGPKNRSDFESEFTTADAIVTIQRARLANRVSALDAQRGGTLDLRRRTIDCYVVGVAMKDVKDVLLGLPVPFVRLTHKLVDNLVRVHIEGSFDDPARRLIRKEPIHDVGTAMQEGTVDFFRGIARGERVGQNVLKTIGGIFEAIPGLKRGETRQPERPL